MDFKIVEAYELALQLAKTYSDRHAILTDIKQLRDALDRLLQASAA